jgi:hypothetical protein
MLTQKELRRMYDKLKAEQDKLEPHLTIHRMREIIGYDGIGSTLYVIEKMVELGLAKKVEWGEQKRYRFL